MLQILGSVIPSHVFILSPPFFIDLSLHPFTFQFFQHHFVLIYVSFYVPPFSSCMCLSVSVHLYCLLPFFPFFLSLCQVSLFSFLLLITMFLVSFYVPTFSSFMCPSVISLLLFSLPPLSVFLSHSLSLSFLYHRVPPTVPKALSTSLRV